MDNLSNWEYLPRKSTREIVEHVVDFSDRLEDDQSISSVSWDSDPSGTLTLSNQSHTQNTATTQIEDGSDGVFYSVRCLITLGEGLKYERSIIVPVGDIYSEPEKLTKRRTMYMARQFMRDYPDENELLFGDLEYDWEDFEMAIQFALQDWNQTPPSTSANFENFPMDARNLLYRRVAIDLIHMGTHGQARNQYNYSDQGFSVQENDKAPMYMKVAQQMEQKYEKAKKKYKLQKNARQFWGGQYSSEFYDTPGGGYY